MHELKRPHLSCHHKTSWASVANSSNDPLPFRLITRALIIIIVSLAFLFISQWLCYVLLSFQKKRLLRRQRGVGILFIVLELVDMLAV